jgi:hypothetical protein
MLTNTQHIRAINKRIDTMGSMGFRPGQVFTNWVALMFWVFQHSDPEYLKVMQPYQRANKSYPERRPTDLFAEMLAELLNHMRLTNEETLGALYQEHAANAEAGQFFTPPVLSLAMAKLTAKGGRLLGRIGDPACGAGSTLIAAVKTMTCEDLNASLLVGVDVDLSCCQMAALNLMFFNVPGVIIHGNSLSTEAWAGWVTSRSYVRGGSIARELTAEEAREWIVGPLLANARAEEPEQTTPAAPPAPKAQQPARGQLVLFGLHEKDQAA